MNIDKVIYSIEEEQKYIYHMMKRNIAGGPSIIFTRYAERNKTRIRGLKKFKKVIGYDANALYLWCLGFDMPCGRLTLEDPPAIDDIMNDKAFGFLECDIETPEHLKEYFSEMTPIFKNVELDPTREEVIGSHMHEHNQTLGEDKHVAKSKKLIGSYFGKRILLYTPLLKWYLQHGMVISKTHSFVRASRATPFKQFMLEVCEARRQGDVDKSKKMIADMMKLIGNSAFGRSGMDIGKHRKTVYLNDPKKIQDEIDHFGFQSIESVGAVGPIQKLRDSYEISKEKRRITLNNPMHISIAIYQLAKLRMLQFYYDLVDKYIERSDFQYLEMDTDSAYIAFSDEEPFKNLIRPELRGEFETDKHNWFPREDHMEYDLRTAGLFKAEWKGDAMISLSPKNYICYNPDNGYEFKISAKGVQQAHGKNEDVLNPDGFESVINDKVSLQATNSGFRLNYATKSMMTYEVRKKGLSYWYDKRVVLEDGVNTVPLDL